LIQNKADEADQNEGRHHTVVERPIEQPVVGAVDDDAAALIVDELRRVDCGEVQFQGIRAEAEPQARPEQAKRRLPDVQRAAMEPLATMP
jgi:hypothetical protein